jgi:hypothetical protein
MQMPEADGKRSAAIDREIDVLRRYFALREADPALAPVYNHGLPEFHYRLDGRVRTLRQLSCRVRYLEAAAARAARVRAWLSTPRPRKALA